MLILMVPLVLIHITTAQGLNIRQPLLVDRWWWKQLLPTYKFVSYRVGDIFF